MLGNVDGITAEEWVWLPPDGQRSIRNIVWHVGTCKAMYENYAFGDATLRWDDPRLANNATLATPESAVGWLRRHQDRLRGSIAALDDTELSKPRMTHPGELKETRWIIAVMIHHDVYHAGEINHLRALCRRDDWEYD